MQGADELAGIVGPCGIEVEALPAGVDSGIGAPAPVGLEALVEDL